MNSYRDEYKSGERNFAWTLPRAVLLVLAVMVAVYVIMVAATPLTIGFGWFHGEAGLRSFPHVQQTYAVAFDDAKAMDANARQACEFKQALAQAQAAGDTNAADQRESQLLAVENNYDRVKGEYDAYLSDHFRGGVIRPHQLPLPYPTLTQREKAVC